MSDPLRKMADAPRKMADAPSKLADAPRKMADAPRKMADAPRKMGDAPRKMGDTPRKMGDTPRKMADTAGCEQGTPRCVGDPVRQDGPNRRTESGREGRAGQRTDRATWTALWDSRTLLNGTYAPGNIRRVWIEKAGGQRHGRSQPSRKRVRPAQEVLPA